MAYKTSILLFKIVVAFCVVGTSLGIGILSSRYIRLPGGRSRVCSKAMSCRYAVCVWSRTFHINPRTCTFVTNSCHCPDFQACMPTRNILPRSGYLKLEYACQTPMSFLMRLPFHLTAKRNATSTE